MDFDTFDCEFAQDQRLKLTPILALRWNATKSVQPSFKSVPETFILKRAPSTSFSITKNPVANRNRCWRFFVCVAIAAIRCAMHEGPVWAGSRNAHSTTAPSNFRYTLYMWRTLALFVHVRHQMHSACPENPPRLLAGSTTYNSSGLQRHKPTMLLEHAKRCPSLRCFT